MADNGAFINKAKYWECICYPENMRADWQIVISDVLQIPYAYCVHDQDKSGHDGDRKKHVHLFEMFEHTNGNTTRQHAIAVANLLSMPGKVCCPAAKPIIRIENAYEYLIHNTDACRKQGKHLYDAAERITGNGFDIERFITLDAEKKMEMAQELADFVVEYRIKDMREAYVKIKRNFDNSYFEIFKSNNAMIDRLCRGNFNNVQRRLVALEVPKCGICGKNEIIGHFQTEKGLLWFCQEHQETAYKLAEEYDKFLDDNGITG